MEGEERGVGGAVEEEGGAGGRGEWCWWALCDSLEPSRHGGIAQKCHTISLFYEIPYLMTDWSNIEGICYEFLLFSNSCPRHVLSVAFFGMLSAFVSYDFRFSFLRYHTAESNKAALSIAETRELG